MRRPVTPWRNGRRTDLLSPQVGTPVLGARPYSTHASPVPPPRLVSCGFDSRRGYHSPLPSCAPVFWAFFAIAFVLMFDQFRYLLSFFL